MAAVGVMRFAINAGFAAGPAVAGLLADHSFRLVFVADAAASAAIGVIALLWLPLAGTLVAAVYAQCTTTFRSGCAPTALATRPSAR